MIQNDIHKALLEVAEQQGWNKESQFIHLCRFLQDLSNENPSGRVMEAWKEYLEHVAFKETRAMSDEAEVGLEGWRDDPN